jgi:hypothetical protein
MRRKTYPSREVDRTIEWQQRRLAGIRAHKPGHQDATLSFHRQLVHDMIGAVVLAGLCIALVFLAFA